MQKQHLDANGVEVGMLICGNGSGFEERNLDYGAALAHAVNEWQLEYFIRKEPRLRAGLVVPQENAEAAVAEIELRASDRSFAQVLISPPGPTFRIGGGPYTVPLSITDAARISTITLTLIFDPTKLRVRSVQEGSFMRSGGINVAFSQQANGNRVDITLARGGDATGASGTGLLAAVLFDAIAPGSVTLTLSGSATGPGGTAMGLRFAPVTINVQ